MNGASANQHPGSLWAPAAAGPVGGWGCGARLQRLAAGRVCVARGPRDEVLCSDGKPVPALAERQRRTARRRVQPFLLFFFSPSLAACASGARCEHLAASDPFQSASVVPPPRPPTLLAVQRYMHSAAPARRWLRLVSRHTAPLPLRGFRCMHASTRCARLSHESRHHRTRAAASLGPCHPFAWEAPLFPSLPRLFSHSLALQARLPPSTQPLTGEGAGRAKGEGCTLSGVAGRCRKHAA